MLQERPRGSQQRCSRGLLPERGSSTEIVPEEILSEYRSVPRRLKVRRETSDLPINLLREEAELGRVALECRDSADPADEAFCACAEESGADFLLTLNPRDFPQAALSAQGLAPVALCHRGESSNGSRRSAWPGEVPQFNLDRACWRYHRVILSGREGETPGNAAGHLRGAGTCQYSVVRH